MSLPVSIRISPYVWLRHGATLCNQLDPRWWSNGSFSDVFYPGWERSHSGRAAAIPMVLVLWWNAYQNHMKVHMEIPPLWSIRHIIDENPIHMEIAPKSSIWLGFSIVIIHSGYPGYPTSSGNRNQRAQGVIPKEVDMWRADHWQLNGANQNYLPYSGLK